MGFQYQNGLSKKLIKFDRNVVTLIYQVCKYDILSNIITSFYNDKHNTTTNCKSCCLKNHIYF